MVLHASIAYFDRENDLIQRAGSSGKKVNITVFGGGHDFMDNLEDWNARHPDKAFSLVVVTPRNYK